MPPSPPTADLLAAALDQVPPSCDARAAAAFLASPVTCLPGTEAGASDDALWVRTHHAPCLEEKDAARVAADVARAAHGDGDRYLNLTGDPSTWFKLIVSGTRTLVAGPALLWGTPRVWVEDTIRPSQVAAYVHHARHGRLDAPPALISSGTPFLVDARGRDVILRSAALGAAGAPPLDAQTRPLEPVGVQVANQLGCSLVSVTLTQPDAQTRTVGGRMTSVVLRAWLPGAPAPRLIRLRVRLVADRWEYADLAEAPPPGGPVTLSYHPSGGLTPRGASLEAAPAWVAAPGNAWVHRASGALAVEVR